MNDERRRSVVKAFRRLTSLEALARDGAQELHKLVSDVCGLVNTDFSDPPLLNVDHRFASTSWSVMLEGRPILQFGVTHGGAAPVRNAVTRCSVVNPAIGEEVAAFHYVKVNDHGQWKVVSADLSEEVAVTDDMILELLNDYAQEELKRFNRV